MGAAGVEPGMRLPLLLLLTACSRTPDTAAPETDTRPEASGEVPYEDVLAAIAGAREDLAARYAAATGAEREAVVAEARGVVESAIVDDLFPRWSGTPWAFYGTTTVPGQGSIACGYFVSTVLEDAGFRVERVRLAQQAAEHIILTLVPKTSIRRFSNAPASEVVDAVHADGDGLYLLGLETHVAFLSKRGDAVQMCHSSYLGTSAVVCEDALTSAAMVSDYRVTGKLLQEPMMVAWLEGRPLPTYGR